MLGYGGNDGNIVVVSYRDANREGIWLDLVKVPLGVMLRRTQLRSFLWLLTQREGDYDSHGPGNLVDGRILSVRAKIQQA